MNRQDSLDDPDGPPEPVAQVRVLPRAPIVMCQIFWDRRTLRRIADTSLAVGVGEKTSVRVCSGLLGPENPLASAPCPLI